MYKNFAQNTYPLTSNQRDIWLDQAVHPDIPLYNIGGYLRIDGKIDRALFKQAVGRLVNKNDALRIVLREDNPTPVQEFREEVNFEFPFIDFAGEEKSFEKAMEWMRTEFTKPFALYDSLLFRYALVKVSEKCYCYFNCQHHLIMDGWGVSLVGKYIAEEYNALLLKTGEAESKPSYKEYIENDQEYLKSRRYEQSGHYWNAKYHDLPGPALLRHYTNLYETGKSPSSVTKLPIAMNLYNRLEELAKPLNASAFHVIIAALYTYFIRTSGECGLVIGMPMLNRSGGSAFRETIGTFTTGCPFRLNLGLDVNFIELTRLVSNEIKKDYRHHRFPLSEINKLCKANNNQFHQLFDISVSFEEHPYEFDFNNSPVEAITMENGFEQVGLALAIKKYNKELPIDIVFNYNNAAFNAAEIELLKTRITCLLRELIDKPNIPVKDFTLIPPEEKNIQLIEWNKTKVESDIDTSVHKVFERVAETAPDKIAIISEDGKTTYEELNRLANCVAAKLVSERVDSPGFVGICPDRNVEMVAAILGIMKAGSSYLPIDPSYPDERIDYMIKDSGLKTILVSEKHIDKFSSYNIKTISLDGLNRKGASFDNIDCKINPENVAYVIYTSGSTGNPKGVLATHKGLRNLVNAQISVFNIQPDSVVLQFASLSFDASVSEIFTAICSGSTLCIFPRNRIMPGPDLIKTLNDFSITHVTIPPSSLSVLPYEELPCLNTIIVAGEACPPELAEKWSKNRRFINAYGPTESTVCATTFEYSQGNGKLHIGKPIDNIQIHILDKELNLLPIGVAGELHIGGAGLAAGYINNQALTDEKFIPNPYSDISGPRLYKTGDIARYQPDGNIEFLGRNDSQVKVRGYRIELGEVETILLQHPMIETTVVVVKESKQGSFQLTGYIVKKQDVNDELDRDKLLLYLKKKLPEYMIPSKIVFVDKMPLTLNGKIDRMNLAKQDYNSSPEIERDTQANKTEKKLMEIWQKVCGNQKIGLSDNFFEFGFDSLQAVQLISVIDKCFDINIPQVELFQRSTIKELALYLDEETAGHQGADTKIANINGSRIEVDELPEEALSGNGSNGTQHSAKASSDTIIIPLSETDGNISFYCMASGQGDLRRFTNLAEKLKDKCSFYMLQPPVSESDNDIMYDLDDLAAIYTKLILSRETRECRIGGFCIGGIVALDVAGRLREHGLDIGEPILIDTLFPILPRIGYISMKLLKRIINLPGLKETGIGRLKINGRPLNVLFSDPGLLKQMKSLHLYKIKNYHGAANLIISKTLIYFHYILYNRWENYVKDTLTKHYIPGFHGNIFSEQCINYLAAVIKQCLK